MQKQKELMKTVGGEKGRRTATGPRFTAFTPSANVGMVDTKQHMHMHKQSQLEEVSLTSVVQQKVKARARGAHHELSALKAAGYTFTTTSDDVADSMFTVLVTIYVIGLHWSFIYVMIFNKKRYYTRLRFRRAERPDLDAQV